jgi:uncharacterized protein YkwD
MPVKQPLKKPYHKAHSREKRTKRFLKTYAPYIPLVLIILTGISLLNFNESPQFKGSVKSYATNTTNEGLLAASNKQRAEQGLQLLTMNETLDNAAKSKANDMAKGNYWSHVSPDGRQPWDFISSKYSYNRAAENLAYGFGTSNSTVSGWMNSPSHRANVLDSSLREVGFGIVNAVNYQGKGPETIVVAMYAEPTPQQTAINVPANPPGQNFSNSEPQNISYIQTLTRGKVPWSGLAAGILIGAIATFLFIKHVRTLRRVWVNTERFALHHPLFDITLAGLIILAIIVSQTSGVIY